MLDQSLQEFCRRFAIAIDTFSTLVIVIFWLEQVLQDKRIGTQLRDWIRILLSYRCRQEIPIIIRATESRCHIWLVLYQIPGRRGEFGLKSFGGLRKDHLGQVKIYDSCFPRE